MSKWCLDWNTCEDNPANDKEYFDNKEEMLERLHDLIDEFGEFELLEYEYYKVKECKCCGHYTKLEECEKHEW